MNSISQKERRILEDITPIPLNLLHSISGTFTHSVYHIPEKVNSFLKFIDTIINSENETTYKLQSIVKIDSKKRGVISHEKHIYDILKDSDLDIPKFISFIEKEDLEAIIVEDVEYKPFISRMIDNTLKNSSFGIYYSYYRPAIKEVKNIPIIAKTHIALHQVREKFKPDRLEGEFTHFLDVKEVEYALKQIQLNKTSSNLLELYEKTQDFSVECEKLKETLIHGDFRLSNIKNGKIFDFGRTHWGSPFVDLGRYYNPQSYNVDEIAKEYVSAFHNNHPILKEILPYSVFNIKKGTLLFSNLHHLSHIHFLLENNLNFTELQNNLPLLKNQLDDYRATEFFDL
jgi:hypothetical protein